MFEFDMNINHNQDLERARWIANGDVEETERFVLAHYKAVQRFLSHLTRCAEDGEDLTQQTFIKAKQTIRSFRGESSLRTWIFRIALNEFRHWKRKHRPWYTLSIAPAQVEPGFAACIEAESLLNALQKIPASHREVFLLHEVEELSVEETADALSIPIGTVKSRLFHARKKLSALLKPGQEEDHESTPVCEYR